MSEIELHHTARGGALPEKLEYAKFLAASGLLPAQYRERPANVLYAVEYGETLGITAMAAINGIHVIEGKPSASAALISALVRRAGHRIRTWGDDEKAVTEIIRSDDPDFTYRVEWTLQRAKQAELVGKGTWKKYPAALLKARTVTECARDACQEVLFGLQYTPEELGAEIDDEGVPVITTARKPPADSRWASKPATPYERQHGVPEPETPTRSWDDEIGAAVDACDVDRLKQLWRDAKGLVDVRERISAAVEQVKAGSATSAADDIEDADIVDDTDPRGEDRTDEYVQAMADETGEGQS